MSDRWVIEAAIDKADKYEWRLPNNEDQHVEHTVAPGDLLIKPSDIDLIPTNSPSRTGIQHGLDDWTYTSVPDSTWYIYGTIVED